MALEDYGSYNPFGYGRKPDQTGYTNSPTPRPLFSGVRGETPAETARRGMMERIGGYVANPNDTLYERTYGTEAANALRAKGILKTPSLAEVSERQADAAKRINQHLHGEASWRASQYGKQADAVQVPQLSEADRILSDPNFVPEFHNGRYGYWTEEEVDDLYGNKTRQRKWNDIDPSYISQGEGQVNFDFSVPRARAAEAAAAQEEQDRLRRLQQAQLAEAEKRYHLYNAYGDIALNLPGAPNLDDQRRAYLSQQAGNLALSVAERRRYQAELSAFDAQRDAERRSYQADQDRDARTEQARIAASVPVSFGGGAGVVPDGNGGWTPVQPPAPEAKPTPPPTPVSFGNGVGAMPGTDENGNPTWTVTRPDGKPVVLDVNTPGYFDGDKWVDNPYFSPQPIAFGGGGGAKWNPETKSWDITMPDGNAVPKRHVIGDRLVDNNGNVLFDGSPSEEEKKLVQLYKDAEAIRRGGTYSDASKKDLENVLAQIAELERVIAEKKGGGSSGSSGDSGDSGDSGNGSAPAGRRRFEG